MRGVLPGKAQLADSLEELVEDLTSATRGKSGSGIEKDSGQDVSLDQNSQ